MGARFRNVTRVLLDERRQEVGERKTYSGFFGGGLFLYQEDASDASTGFGFRPLSKTWESFLQCGGCEEAYIFKRMKPSDFYSCPPPFLRTNFRPRGNLSEACCTVEVRASLLERRSILYPRCGASKESIATVVFVIQQSGEQSEREARRFCDKIARRILPIESVNRVRDCNPCADACNSASGIPRVDIAFMTQPTWPDVQSMTTEASAAAPCHEITPTVSVRRMTHSGVSRELSESFDLAKRQGADVDQLTKLSWLISALRKAREFKVASDTRCDACQQFAFSAPERGSTLQRSAFCVHSASALASKLAVLFDLQHRRVTQPFFTVLAATAGLLTDAYFLRLSESGRRRLSATWRERRRGAWRRAGLSAEAAAAARARDADAKYVRRVLPALRAAFPGADVGGAVPLMVEARARAREAKRARTAAGGASGGAGGGWAEGEGETATATATCAPSVAQR